MARYIWDPFEELRRMQERMSRLFEELPETIGPSLPVSPEMTQMPYVDVMEKGNDVIVTADLPGVDKKDIKISVRGDVLEISAERKMEREEKEKGYLRHERSYNRFYRSIRLPAPVDKGKAKASLNNGVLEVTLPKIEKAEVSEIPIV
ncbi:Hsp20/alpha crystallin family protein [Methanocella conradii]|uniref:Hsp20/alpha crystallin family protein n=1 Tax=Methanocella conradii TaxID=1175444 RepID=UPI0024B35C0F|nr:Hsp20/alpha crystallin family protein [Methanocella conradii]MDI6897392.1 Hsp20/alpha crystallin family protein [Methanocella conradii]